MAWSRDPDRYRGVPRAQAERIRRRDGHRCQICGEPGREVDHKTNKAEKGSDRDENLWVLCAAHHQAKTNEEAARGRARRRAGARIAAEPHPGLR